MVVTDRDGKTYEAFVPVLAPPTCMEFSASSRNEVPFEVWASCRLECWLNKQYSSLRSFSVAFSHLSDRGIAPFSEVSSFDGLVKLGYRALGIILKQVF